jgi:hypothetical protein
MLDRILKNENAAKKKISEIDDFRLFQIVQFLPKVPPQFSKYQPVQNPEGILTDPYVNMFQALLMPAPLYQHKSL